MNHRYVWAMLASLFSAMDFACSSADVPKELTSSSRQELVAPAAAPAAVEALHYATARRMTPDEVAALLAVDPSRVQPPIEVLRQNFQNALSALVNGQGGSELDEQKLFLAAALAAHNLPPAERTAAQGQIAAFVPSGSGVQ